jgi:signal transduction histidine kinase
VPDYGIPLPAGAEVPSVGRKVPSRIRIREEIMASSKIARRRFVAGTAAALQLRVSQLAVSQVIVDLEHALGVKLFDVKLLGSPTEVRLTVRDLGNGFDPELAKETPGLGLISMRERVRLVKGTISIRSRPQSGTEINVRVPLSAGAQTEMAKLAGA